MKLITCAGSVLLGDKVVVNPMERWVVGDGKAHAWYKLNPSKTRVSATRFLERPYYAQDLNNKSLLVYRGCGFGDTLFLSRTFKELKDLYPSAKIVLTNEGDRIVHLLGLDQPDSQLKDIFTWRDDQISVDEYTSFDYHMILVDFVESYNEPDQPDVWDMHQIVFGLPTLPQEKKCAPPFLTASHKEAAEQALRGMLDRPFILYQLRASARIRSQSDRRIFETTTALMRAFPHHNILPVGGKQELEVVLPDGVNTRLINGSAKACFGSMMLPQCAGVLAPDSCLNHVAGSLGKDSPPVVSLWSSFPPESRISGYANNHPIYNRIRCSPCRVHERGDVKGCPLKDMGNCDGLDRISNEEIVEMAKKHFHS